MTRRRGADFVHHTMRGLGSRRLPFVQVSQPVGDTTRLVNRARPIGQQCSKSSKQSAAARPDRLEPSFIASQLGAAVEHIGIEFEQIFVRGRGPPCDLTQTWPLLLEHLKGPKANAPRGNLWLHSRRFQLIAC